MKYKVWSCKIVIADDEILPMGFDAPPRQAAVDAVERHGIKVLTCFSGWAGTLTKPEQSVVNMWIRKEKENS